MSNGIQTGGARMESVWDYPRPPRLERTAKQIRVEFGGIVIADSNSTFRVLETSHPPVYYIPPADIAMQFLLDDTGDSYCEWKGRASYHQVVVGGARAARAAWSYTNPTPAFQSIRDFIAFYPAPMDGCYVDGERVVSQPGDFYGGWITSDLLGPFKGAPGTRGW
jgi:uncharacterized protein (DUF427 family)